MALSFPVTPEKARDLERRMAVLGLAEGHLDEQFVKASGKGGQHVNKNNTCVVLTHKATGIQVKVQDSRSQALNRFLARRRLVERLEGLARKARPDTPPGNP